MKKRMQTVMPTLLVLVAFLFFGASVQAQSFSTSPAATGLLVNGTKTTVAYQPVDEAQNILGSEYDATFPAVVVDQNSQANTRTFYKMKFYSLVHQEIETTNDVGIGIVRAHATISTLVADKPFIDADAWYEEMVTLLSL